MPAEQLNENDIAEQLLTIVAAEGMIEGDGVDLNARLTDLDIGSTDFVMILMAVEEKYDVYLTVDNEMSKIETVQHLVSVITQKIVEQKQQAAS